MEIKDFRDFILKTINDYLFINKVSNKKYNN